MRRNITVEHGVRPSSASSRPNWRTTNRNGQPDAIKIQSLEQQLAAAKREAANAVFEADREVKKAFDFIKSIGVKTICPVCKEPCIAIESKKRKTMVDGAFVLHGELCRNTFGSEQE